MTDQGQEPNQHSISELNKLYSEADQADQDIFAEQRSNVLLIAGEHYTRRNAKYWNRIRDSKDLSNEQKVRLTKNHLQKIAKTYVNNIVSQAPSVKVVPQNEKEMQDQKSAQLNDSVWQYGRHKQNLKMKTAQFAKDYVDLGEVAAKLFWNPTAGKFLGYKAEMDEGGNPVMDESGQMVSSKTPAFSGDLQVERLFAFNLLRDPSAKSMLESKFFIIRKMVALTELKAMVAGDEDKLKMIQEQKDDTFLVFDGNHQNYQKSEGMSMLKEFYFKPCVDYPLGYYYITVEGGILFEGELPFGIFPIIYEGFDEIQTSPRHRSIIKQLRPYQAELNRAASKIAEHQVTLGDDKILVQSGTKVTTGVHLPGVRSIQYSGMAPTILAGRAGDQYLTYMTSQIAEMYQVANISEDTILKGGPGADPFGQLFQSVHDKKKFTIYTDKFEQFLCTLCRTYLDLARNYFSQDMLIPMIGRAEVVNISEFKNTTDLSYSIKTEPLTDDITTMMGRQLTINHALQYVGSQMTKEDIGKLMRAMPFGNFDESFSDMTLNYDSATNMILALDRGGTPQPNKYDDSTYMIQRLVARQRMSDFAMLSPQIQQNYQQLTSLYEDQETQKQQQILAAQAEFIPSGGARIKVDYYVPDPTNPDRPVRATLPAESVDWLIKRLADQGSSQQQMTTMNQGAVGEIAAKLQQQGPPPQGQPPMPGNQLPMAPQGPRPMMPQAPSVPIPRASVPPMPNQGMVGRRMP
jgi:hypothetical protein